MIYACAQNRDIREMPEMIGKHAIQDVFLVIYVVGTYDLPRLKRSFTINRTVVGTRFRTHQDLVKSDPEDEVE